MLIKKKKFIYVVLCDNCENDYPNLFINVFACAKQAKALVDKLNSLYPENRYYFVKRDLTYRFFV